MPGVVGGEAPCHQALQEHHHLRRVPQCVLGIRGLGLQPTTAYVLFHIIAYTSTRAVLVKHKHPLVCLTYTCYARPSGCDARASVRTLAGVVGLIS